MKSPGHPSLPKVCVLVLMLVSYTDAFVVAAPRAPRVVSGTATIQQDGNMTVINASNRSVINYQSFDIGPAETVRFVQPNASSTVLNRVTSPNPTNIFGQLQANGIVYIVNPYGVYFQNGSVLNVGGLIAAAGHISDRDFTAGRIHFTDLTGDVRNDGVLAADNRIALMGANVVNNGKVTVARGVAMMTSGSDIYVGEKGGNIYVQANGAATASAPAGSVANRGTVAAPRVVLGAGDMYSTAIVNTGLLQGRSVAVNAGRNGTATVGGKIDASAVNTKRNAGKGGDIQVTGGTVALQAATLDASGVNGGGSVRVGGDFHGGGTIAHATTTTADAATVLKADATGAKGNGGTVVLWSDGATSFSGKISARGGSTGGDGGSVEVSSHGALGYYGTVDTSAPAGKIGSLLLDPGNIEITAGGSTTPVSNAEATTPLDLPAILTVSQNALEASTTAITLTASNDIRVDAMNNGQLTLQADATFTAGANTTQGLLTPGGQPSVGSFVMANLGDSIVAPGHNITIRANGPSVGLGTLTTGIGINGLQGDTTNAISVGTIDASNPAGNGGTVTLQVTGNAASAPVRVAGSILTSSLVGGGTGGNIAINGTALNVVGALNANSATAGLGGAITLASTTGTTLGAPVTGASLGVTGPAALNGGLVTTSGDQTYAGAVTLGANTILQSNNGGTISLAAVDSDAAATPRTLTVNSPTGTATYNAPVGGNQPFVSLTTTANTINLAGGSVRTVGGGQSYTGTIALQGPAGTTALTDSGGGAITLAGPVDGAQALTLSTTGAEAFNGPVGANTPLASLTADGFGGTVGAAVSVGAGQITTVGSQTYNKPFTLTAGLTATSQTGGTILFANTVDSDADATPRALFVVSPGGTVQFAGNVGSLHPLASLQTGNTGSTAGTTRFGTNGTALTVTTNGAAGQSYYTAVTLLGDTTMGAGAGPVSFFNLLDSNGANGQPTFALTLNTTTAASFGGRIGSVNPLTGLTITSATTSFAFAAGAGAGVQLGAGGLTITTATGATNPGTTLNITGSVLTDASRPSILSAGPQTYGNNVTLAADTFLQTTGTGSAVTFNGTVNAAVGGGAGLSVNARGGEVFKAAVGGTFPLLSLRTGVLGNAGGVTFGPGVGTVTTGSDAGADIQAYSDAVVLQGTTTVRSTNAAGTAAGTGAITFGNTVNGTTAYAQSLTVDTRGATTFSGLVGRTTPLNALTSGELGSPGSTTFNVNLGTALPAGAAGSGVAARTVTINDLALFNVVGTASNRATVTTTGVQNYNGAVQLGADTILTSLNTVNDNGTITFAQTVDSAALAAPRALTVNTPGDEVFNGRVGGTNPLGSLATDATGTVGGAARFNMTVTAPAGGGVAAGVTVGAGGIVTNDSTVFNVTGGGTPATPGVLALAKGTQTYSVGSANYAATTTVAQDTVLVGVDATVVPTTTAGYQNGGAVTFTGAVAGAGAGAQSLTVYTGTGTTSFEGDVNVGTLDAGGAQVTFESTVNNLNLLRTVANPGGTGLPLIDIDANITTVGAQEYRYNTVLSADVTLTSTAGGNLTFDGRVDSLLTGYYTLTLNTNGSTIFRGQVGGQRPLRGLIVGANPAYRNGLTTFNFAGTTAAPSVTTINNGVAGAGLQEYYNRVRLNADTVLASVFNGSATAGGNLIFHGTVNSTPGGPNYRLELNTSGNETFLARVGDENPLLSLTTDAGTTNRGGATIFNVPGGTTAAPTVLTTGAQTYNDRVSLALDTVLTGGGNLTFNSFVDSLSATSLSNLELNSPANEVFRANVGGTSPLLSLVTDADPTNRGGAVVFGAAGDTGTLAVVTVNNGTARGGVQTFNDAVVLNLDTTLTSNAAGGQIAGGNVTFSGTVDGPRGLTVNTGALTIFNRLVGSATPLAFLTTDGQGAAGEQTQFLMPIPANTAGVRVGGDVTVGDAVLFNAAGGVYANSPTVLTFNNGRQSYLGAATVSANTVLVGTASPTAPAPGAYAGGNAIGFARPVASANASNLTIYTGTGTTTFRNTVTVGSVDLQGANVTFADTVTGLGALLVGRNDAAAGVINLNGGTVQTSAGLTAVTGDQYYRDAVSLSANARLNDTAGSNVYFASTVDGNYALALNTTGDEYFQGLVGRTAPLFSLTIDGAADPAAALGTAHFNMTLMGQGMGIAGVRVGAGGVLINDTVAFNVAGSTQANPSLLVYGNGTQTYNGAVNLQADTVLVGTDAATAPTTTAYTGGGAILFARTVTGAVPPTPNLTIYTGAGLESYHGTVNVNTLLSGGAAVTFAGAVSGINTLQTVANPTNGVPTGTVDINNDITTFNGQTYNAAAVLSQDVTLTSTGNGDIRFARTLDSDNSGTYALTINTGGATVFGGLVGGNRALLSLTTNAGGVTQINGGGVTTANGQTYNDAVTLGADTFLTGGGDIRFNSTLDGAHDLTVRTPSDEYFEGLVGSTAALTNLTVDNLLPPGGTTHFDMTVGTAAAGVNVTGIVTIYDGVVFNAPGASLDHPTVLAGVQQNYGSPGNAATPVTLLQPTFLQIAAGSSGIEAINFRSTVDGAFGLTLNAFGDEVFDAVVGGTAPLASLTVDNLYNPTHTPDGGTTSTRFGTTIFLMDQPASGAGVSVSGAVEINDQIQFAVRGSSVTDPAHPSVLTGGAQTYYSLATLVTDTSLRSTGGGDITFNSGVTSAAFGPRALALFTDGEKVFNGTVGTNALLSLTTSAGGATRINGVNVITTGFQTYNSPVLLGADTNLLSFGGGDITFNATLDSDSATARALTINTAGNEVFNGRVGSGFALRSLRTDDDPRNRGGVAIFNVPGGANTVVTTDFQTYNDAVQLSRDTFLTSTGGGAILFNQAVNGPAALTLSTAGDMTFQAPVGDDTPLAGLTAGGGGTIFLNGERVTTTGSQVYNGPVALGTDTTLVSTGAGAVRFAFTLDGAHTLTIRTAGDEFFEGLVGSQSPLDNLFIDDPNDFGGTAHFDMAADGAAAGVNITGNLAIRDNTAFNATLTGTDLVPTVRTGGSQAYQGTVTAGSAGTTFLQSTGGNVLFLNDVTVASNLLRVDARRVLAHDIRAASGDGHSLDLEATELLLLAGNTYNLGTGSISLNTDSTARGGLGDPRFNDASTIVLKPEGGSQVNFAAGNFSMGYLQTMLAFGSVNIRAGNEATLSSIEATGSLTVDAPNITLLSRPTSISLRGRDVGLIFAATQIDFGGGNVRFRNTRPGDAAQAAFFSTVGSVVIQRVPGISLFSDPNLRTRFQSLDSAAYEAVARATTAANDGTLIPISNQLSNLPVLTLNTLQGNQFLDVAAALAGALPLLNHDLDLPSDGLAITAAQLEQLKKLGINPRLAERNERSSIRDKRALFAQLVDKNDTENYGRLQPIKGAVSRLVPSDFVVVVDRMSAVEVQSILQAFEQVYGKDQTKVPAISDKLQAAYVDYVTASPNTAGEGHGFAAFVQKNPAKYGDLNPTVRDFDNLFGRLEGLGLTEVEVAKSEEHIVHNVQPTGLSDGETRRFINDLRKGLPTDQRAPSNSQPPSPPVTAPEKKPTPAPHTAGRQKTDAPAARQARRAPVPTPVPGRTVAER